MAQSDENPVIKGAPEQYEEEVFRLMKDVSFCNDKSIAIEGLRSLPFGQILTVYEDLFVRYLELTRLRMKFLIMATRNWSVNRASPRASDPPLVACTLPSASEAPNARKSPRKRFEEDFFRMMKEVNFSNPKTVARGFYSLKEDQLLSIYEDVVKHHLELIRFREKFCFMVARNAPVNLASPRASVPPPLAGTLPSASEALYAGESSRKRPLEQRAFRLMKAIVLGNDGDISPLAGSLPGKPLWKQARDDIEEEVFRLMKILKVSNSESPAREALRDLKDDQLFTIYEDLFVHNLELVQLRLKVRITIIKSWVV